MRPVWHGEDGRASPFSLCPCVPEEKECFFRQARGEGRRAGVGVRARNRGWDSCAPVGPGTSPSQNYRFSQFALALKFTGMLLLSGPGKSFLKGVAPMVGPMKDSGSRELRFWGKVQRCIHSQSRPGQHYADCMACCWPWVGALDERQRGKTRYMFDNQDETYASRVAWRFANQGSAVPAGQDIAQSCNHPPCCNPSHLEPETQHENQQGMVARGRASTSQHGGFRPRKMTWGKVDELRALASTEQHTCRELGAMPQFAISAQMVSNILCGRAWGRASEHTRQGEE